MLIISHQAKSMNWRRTQVFSEDRLTAGFNRPRIFGIHSIHFASSSEPRLELETCRSAVECSTTELKTPWYLKGPSIQKNSILLFNIFCKIGFNRPSKLSSNFRKFSHRERPDLNQGPLDLQSNALPLSYTPLETHCSAAFGSIAKWNSLKNICISSYWQLHCWCSGIMQDSHSCDSGSIPGRCSFRINVLLDY